MGFAAAKWAISHKIRRKSAIYKEKGRKPHKNLWKSGFSLDFAYPQAALFSTTGFSGPA
jgi:hypothetical protein